jgi:hypothetical protein
MLLQEGMQVMPLYVRAPTPLASQVCGTRVSPIGSVNTGSKPTVRKAHIPSGNRKNQEAKVASRKAREMHNPANRAIKGDGDTQAERSQTWFWYLTQRTL